MNEHCSTIIKDDLPPKERDPGSFTLPCTINNMHFNKALANLGASACSFMLCNLDFEPLSLSLSSMPSCDLVSLTNILILCLILKASNQCLRKSLSLNLEHS
ncbi:hypothetical protein Tco_0036004 [Tanacetum coccineum]